MQKKSAKKCLDFAGIEVLAKPIFIRGFAPSMEAALPPATVAD